MHGPGRGPRKWSRLGEVKEEVAFPKCASHTTGKEKGRCRHSTFFIEITLIDFLPMVHSNTAVPRLSLTRVRGWYGGIRGAHLSGNCIGGDGGG